MSIVSLLVGAAVFGAAIGATVLAAFKARGQRRDMPSIRGGNIVVACLALASLAGCAPQIAPPDVPSESGKSDKHNGGDDNNTVVLTLIASDTNQVWLQKMCTGFYGSQNVAQLSAERKPVFSMMLFKPEETRFTFDKILFQLDTPTVWSAGSEALVRRLSTDWKEHGNTGEIVDLSDPKSTLVWAHEPMVVLSRRADPSLAAAFQSPNPFDRIPAGHRWSFGDPVVSGDGLLALNWILDCYGAAHHATGDRALAETAASPGFREYLNSLTPHGYSITIHALSSDLVDQLNKGGLDFIIVSDTLAVQAKRAHPGYQIILPQCGIYADHTLCALKNMDAEHYREGLAFVAYCRDHVPNAPYPKLREQCDALPFKPAMQKAETVWETTFNDDRRQSTLIGRQ